MNSLIDDLPPMHLAGRADRVRARLSTHRPGAGALLVSDLTNVRWLTGFTGSSGWAVLTADEVVLVTDGRYGEQAAQQMDAAGVEGRVLVGLSGEATMAHLVDATKPFATLAFEAAHVSYARYQAYRAALAPELVPVEGMVEGERRVKDAAELARIAAACAIADAALADVAPQLGDGLTEAEVRNLLEARMRDLGAAGPSYETIVASGPANAALPHHRPTGLRIESGHTVIIDVGALLDGYHSDMTRSFIVGEPTAHQREVYDVVLAAQLAGLAAVRAGVAAVEVDAACRDAIAAAGYGEWFTHGTGHGVGLLIHEDPYLNRTSGFTLQEGEVVTVEPGVYRGDLGGIRVEDLVVVTSDGCRVLTGSPKDSPCLPSPPTT